MRLCWRSIAGIPSEYSSFHSRSFIFFQVTGDIDYKGTNVENRDRVLIMKDRTNESRSPAQIFAWAWCINTKRELLM